jgi:hypothetical protein
MFYYIEVHLLAHYIQWIKMHGETVKFIDSFIKPVFGHRQSSQINALVML